VDHPSKASYRAAITHVLSIAPSPPCIPNARCAHSSSLPMEDLTCPICCSTLQQPVQLKTCQSVVCCPCLVRWLQVSEDLHCPCCYSNHLSDFSTMEAAHPLLQKILGRMKVRCAKCTSEVQMQDIRHIIANPRPQNNSLRRPRPQNNSLWKPSLVEGCKHL